MLLYQHEDGGWGTRGSTSEETAYAVLALRALGADRAPAADQALLRGERWMRVNYRPFFVSPVTCWIGKETYQPTRLARVIELAATIPVEASVTASVALAQQRQVLMSSWPPRSSRSRRSRRRR